MSGDNLHGKQPIKFYSEEITLTKVELLERQLNLGEKITDLDQKHKEWSKRLSGWLSKIKKPGIIEKNKFLKYFIISPFLI